MKTKTMGTIQAGLVILTGAMTLASAGCGDERAQPAETASQLVNMERLTALINQQLPAWDGAVLAAKDGAAWSADVGYGDIAAAVADRPLPATIADVGRVADAGRVARLDRGGGRVRYISHERAWTLDRSAVPFGDDTVAVQAVGRALARLRLPTAEMGRVRVDAQVAEVAPGGEPDGKIHDVYRLVSWPRHTNGLPVQGSRVVGAVTQDGAIQRLLVNWPQFAMRPGLKLRTRDAVVTQLANALARQEPAPTDERMLTARLAYVPERQLGTTPRPQPGDGDVGPPSDDTDKVGGDATYPTRKRHAGEVVRYVPAVVVSVSAGETPYQLAVAVAELVN